MLVNVGEKLGHALDMHRDAQIVADEPAQPGGVLGVLEHDDETTGQIHAVDDPGAGFTGIDPEAEKHAARPGSGQHPQHLPQGCRHARLAGLGVAHLAEPQIGLRRSRMELPRHVSDARLACARGHYRVRVTLG